MSQDDEHQESYIWSDSNLQGFPCLGSRRTKSGSYILDLDNLLRSVHYIFPFSISLSYDTTLSIGLSKTLMKREYHVVLVVLSTDADCD